MKFKLYTKLYNESLLKKFDKNAEYFTAEEHACLTKEVLNKDFESRELLLQRFLSKNQKKLLALDFLIKYVNKQEFSNILSLGAGSCVLEYLLKCSLPKESKVVATDFDSFLIEKAKLYFPSIVSTEFDFFKDEIDRLQNRLDIHFDLAIFFGSTYTMDDPLFVHHFKRLRQIGVKQIIDFHTGYIPYSELPAFIFMRSKSYILNELRKIKIIDKVINKIKPASYRGKFHGYGRTRKELRRLYKKAGVHLTKEMSIGLYKYVAICKAN